MGNNDSGWLYMHNFIPVWPYNMSGTHLITRYDPAWNKSVTPGVLCWLDAIDDISVCFE